MDSIHTVERYVKNHIYPKIKFLSDNEEDYRQPNFVGEVGKKKPQQAATICTKMLHYLDKSHYNIKQTVSWWVAYRKIIKTKLCKLRHADVRSLQLEFVEGQCLYFVFEYIVVLLINCIFVQPDN